MVAPLVATAGFVAQSFNDLARPAGVRAPEGTPLYQCFVPESGNMTGSWGTTGSCDWMVAEQTDLQSAVANYVSGQSEGLGPTSIGFKRGARTRWATYRSFAKPIGSPDRPVYLSFLVKMVGNNAEGAILLDGDIKPIGYYERKGIHLGDDGAPGDLGIMDQSNDTTPQQLGDLPLAGSAAGKRVDLALHDGNTHLVVGRIVFGTTDTFQIWVDPNVATEEDLLAITPALTFSGYDMFPNNYLAKLGVEMVRDPNANISFDNFKLSDAPNAFASVYQGAQPLIDSDDFGTVLNINPTFDQDLTGWNDSTGGVWTLPGILNETAASGGVRLQGVGDPSGNPPGHFGQNVPVGAKDFELTTWMAVIPKSEFENEAGAAISGAKGDRLFQMLVMGGDGTVPGAPGITADERSKIMVNLAYFPAGVTEAGAEGFYVKSQLSGWVMLPELGIITGSSDANGDGILSSADGDSVMPYQIRIKGTGFSTASPSYIISLYDPRTETTVSTQALTYQSALSPAASTPSAVVFTTSDTEPPNGSGTPVTTSFWIDDTAYYASSASSIFLNTSGETTRVYAINGTSGIAEIILRNDARNPAALYSASSNNPRFAVSGLPLLIPPQTSLTVPIRFDASGMAAGEAATTRITFVTNDATTPIRSFPVIGARVTPGQMAVNGGFDFTIADQPSTPAALTFWRDTTPVSELVSVPSIRSGPGASMYLKPGNTFLSQRIHRPFSDAVVDFHFAIRPPVEETRQASFVIQQYPLKAPELINIKYENGMFWACVGLEAVWHPILTLALTPSIDPDGDGDFSDPGNSVHPYRCVLSIHGLGTAAASYELDIYEAGGATPIGSSGTRSYFRNPAANLSDAISLPLQGRTITFTSAYGDVPGWWVDDVNVRAILTTEPKVEAFHQSGSPQGFTMEWYSNREPVTIERNLGLDSANWEVISTDNQDGTFTDPWVSGRTKAFYRFRRD